MSTTRRFRCKECGANYYVVLDNVTDENQDICQNCAGTARKPSTAAETARKEAEKAPKAKSGQKQAYDPRGPGQTTPVPGTQATSGHTKETNSKKEKA